MLTFKFFQVTNILKFKNRYHSDIKDNYYHQNNWKYLKAFNSLPIIQYDRIGLGFVKNVEMHVKSHCCQTRQIDTVNKIIQHKQAPGKLNAKTF